MMDSRIFAFRFSPGVLLICPHSHRSAIAHHVHSDISSSTFSTLRVDIQTYEDDDTHTLGTCSILRRFASRIQVSISQVVCRISE